MGTLNDQLAKVYNEKWDGFVERLKGKNTDLAYPFLLAMNKWIKQDGKDIPDETWYTQADIKVMIFGQETNTWKGIPDDDSFPIRDYFDLSLNPETIMGIYENQYSRYNLCPPDSYRFCGTSSQGFLNIGINDIMSVIDDRLKERRLNLMPVCIWNDISKLGRAGDRGGVSPEIHEIEQKYFHVIPEEVNILNPDVIIFLTGPNEYEKYICENFDIQPRDFVPINNHYNVKEIAKVNLPNGRLAYRTYHPCVRPKDIKQHIYEHHRIIVDDIMQNLDKILKK